jgi:uncharacterized protein (DUF2235 family)
MVKKLAVFCDGTWNQLRIAHLTNVAKLAKCVAPADRAGIAQIVFYDEGVGVDSNISWLQDKLVVWVGGALGRGLDRKVESAYRFIALNYDPDDEIYIFGFSRGAFTARSLCGLIRKCGIVRRDGLDQVPQALELYRGDLHPNDPHVVSFRQQYSHPRTTGDTDQWVTPQAGTPRSRPSAEADALADNFQYRSELSYRMMYLGVWDTVGSLGVPTRFEWLRFLNRKYQFHDTNASALISSIRHAVAIEEFRRVFDVTPVSNVRDLNLLWAQARGWDIDNSGDPKFVPYNHRPYQQQWFPGNHGAVGGGHVTTGLSNAALCWIAEGAHNAGLAFRDDPATELRSASQAINPMEDWLVNDDGAPATPAGRTMMGRLGGTIIRGGPKRVDEVGLPAKVRWCRNPAWRPSNLNIMNITDCRSYTLPPAPPGFPPPPPGFPCDWTYGRPASADAEPEADRRP